MGKRVLYAASLPYPSARAEGCNPAYARIVLESFGGAEGELTAITTYTYQDIELGESYQEVAETLHGIAIVEMRHLRMLGDLVKSLGGDPVFGAYQRRHLQFWDGGNVNYTKTLGDLLLADIRMEEAAIFGYRQAAERIEDDAVCAVLERIALDEEVHLALLKELLERYC